MDTVPFVYYEVLRRTPMRPELDGPFGCGIFIFLPLSAIFTIFTADLFKKIADRYGIHFNQ